MHAIYTWCTIADEAIRTSLDMNVLTLLNVLQYKMGVVVKNKPIECGHYYTVHNN